VVDGALRDRVSVAAAGLRRGLRSRDRRRRVVTAGVPLMIGDAPVPRAASSAVVERVARTAARG
jgi:hypothetical protein